jgi:hypothetical protein
MDLNAQRFCLPYSTFTMDLNSQMVKLLAIQDNVSQMATYVAQMSQHLAIQDNQPTIPDNQPMLNSNGAGADTAEQNSHDAGSASSGNVLMARALLSATGVCTDLHQSCHDERLDTALHCCKKRDTLLLLRSSLQLAPTMTFQRQQVGQLRFLLLQKMGTFMS